MNIEHYTLRCSAESFGGDIMISPDLFSEGEKSKSQEHNNRLSVNKISQKIEKNEDNQS